MRTLSVLLLGMAMSAHAQHPKIIGFDGEAMLMWTNPDTNNYFATDYTWNLNYTWYQPDSYARATQSVMETTLWDVGIPSAPDFSALWSLAEAMGDNTDNLFVRIRVASEPLESGRVTNWVRVCNSSTSVLENLTFGIESLLGNRGQWDINVPLLAAHSNTTFHALSFPWPNIFGAWGPETAAGSYYLAYTQAGRHHDHAPLWAMPIGPSRKEVALTVSNDSVSVKFGWLPNRYTVSYSNAVGTIERGVGTHPL